MADLTRRQTLAIAGTAVATLAFPAAAQSTNPIKIGFCMALSGGRLFGTVPADSNSARRYDHQTKMAHEP